MLIVFPRSGVSRKRRSTSIAKEIRRLTEDASSYASAASAAVAEHAKKEKEAGVHLGDPGGGLGASSGGGGPERCPGLQADRPTSEPAGLTIPEAVRSLELPALPSASCGDASIQLGDWLTVARPLMSDLSSSAQQWWDLAVAEAEVLYEKWLSASPLMRLRIKSELPIPESSSGLNSECAFLVVDFLTKPIGAAARWQQSLGSKVARIAGVVGGLAGVLTWRPSGPTSRAAQGLAVAAMVASLATSWKASGDLKRRATGPSRSGEGK